MTAQSAATVPFTLMSNAIRFLAMDAVQAANSGHPGMPMGMADVATVLYSKFLKFDPTAPTWSDRDRFVLSAGHGSMLLYAINYLTGYEALTIDQIKRFRQLGSITAGHPEVDHEAGIETTTGPLGQGLANAVGMALAERILNARFGDGLVDHRTWVIAGDGCMMEGISHEAASLAGHLKLGRLNVLYDDNQISIDGPTSLSFSDDTPKRFEAYGWHVIHAVDGHDPAAIEKALAEAVAVSDRPTLVCCKTVIGKGAPTKGGTDKVHGSPLGLDEVAAARSHLDWSHEPFVVPPEVLDAWRAVGRRCRGDREAWESRLAKVASETRDAFVGAMAGRLPADLGKLFEELKRTAAEEAPKLATRQCSGRVLEALVPAVPELIGGSADLTPSNNTKTPASTDIKPGAYGGRYIRWGVREHGMAAGMNGLALHGGVIPYGATFLTFTDYCRPAIRLSALMHQRVVYVMTHDSIGLGEDGPTHQPVEHLPALRAMPNLLVLRPADLVETIECWQIALEQTRRPSILSLTRQALPAVRKNHRRENLSARGAYVLAEASRSARATIFASGSEVAIALDARSRLEAEGVPTRVVSVPSFELFAEQDEEYRAAILGEAGVKVAVEAAMRFGWESFIGAEGGFVGMNGFGASAPIDDLYRHFGITADAVVGEVRARL